MAKQIKVSKNTQVKKSDVIVKSRYKLNPIALKFITVIISAIKRDDDVNERYEIGVKYFKEFSKLKSNDIYRAIKEALYDLLNKPLYIPTDKGFIMLNWISDAEYKAGEGIVEFSVSSKLRPYLLEVKEKFLKYKLENILPLKSSYSIRLYEFLKNQFEMHNRYGKIAEEIIDLDYFKTIFEIPKSYNYSDIKRRILEKSKRDLAENTDILFEYEEIKSGKKVVSIKFIVKENPNKIIFYDQEDYKNKYFFNLKAFISFIRKQYAGTEKYFIVGKSTDNKTCWYGLDNKGYLYANCNGELVSFNMFESMEKYEKFYKIAKNSELYKEILKEGFNVKELYEQNKDLFNEIQREINSILQKD